MISKILVATDGSDAAGKAVEYAIDTAKQTGASLTLLSVVNRDALFPQTVRPRRTPANLAEPVEDYLTRAAETYLDEAELRCAEEQVPARKVIRKGHPVEEISKEAQKSKCDLVIVGSHGRTALKAAVLGSVAFGIISGASRFPVLVVRQ